MMTPGRRTSIDGITVLGGHDPKHRLIQELRGSEVILAVTHDIDDAALRALIKAQEQGVELMRMASLYEDVAERVPVERVEPDWLTTSLIDTLSEKDASRLAKRAVDLAGSLKDTAGRRVGSRPTTNPTR